MMTRRAIIARYSATAVFGSRYLRKPASVEQQRADRLAVGDLAPVERCQHLVDAHRAEVEEFALVEFRANFGQPFRDVELDRLVRIADYRVDHAEPCPRGCAIARLFDQLALDGRERILVPLELARRKLDEH